MDTRRKFLQFLAASPLLAGRDAMAQAVGADGLDPVTLQIDKPEHALDIGDLQRVAKKNIPPAHWGYLITGVDGEQTLRANQEAYAQWQLHTRRLIDISKIDMSVEIFGTRYNSPIYLNPLHGQKAYHPDGELAAARAAKKHNQLQILATGTSTAVEEVAKAREAPIWFQLYTGDSLEYATKLIKRAASAGCPAIAVTVDRPIPRNTPTQERWRRLDKRNCLECHAGGDRSPMQQGMEGIDAGSRPKMTWDFMRRLRDATKQKLLVKGIEVGEDAELAVKYGFDGVIVSNHGGRAFESGRSTIESLPEVVKAVNGKAMVFVDGGVRRGTDVLKALALGATAVGIGRPYIWGMGAFGEAGVSRALEILNLELNNAMVGVSARTLKEITPAAIRRA